MRAVVAMLTMFAVTACSAAGEGDAGAFRELVLIDATEGGVALHFDQMAHGRDRRVCDAALLRMLERRGVRYAE